MKIYTNKPELLNQNIFDLVLKLTDNFVENIAVGVQFVSSFKIKSLNKKIRGINKITDVLSFPMLDAKKIHFLQDFDNERDPFSNELYIGDIAICLCRAKKQAKSFGHSVNREISFLALHGFLHLLGFDHLTKRDEKEMMSLAEKVLASFDIKREG